MSTIFLTGGMGNIGKRILTILAEKHRIIALGYRKQGIQHPSIEWVTGDIRRPESYLNYLKKCDVLVHLAADVSNTSSLLHETNVRATNELVLSARQVGCKKIIIFSSAAVTQDFLTPYSRSKKIMEEELSQMNIPMIVVRPTLVYSKGSNYLRGMEHYLHLPLPFVPLPNGGNADLRPIHVEDVGKALLRVIEGPVPPKFCVYDWASRESFTFGQALALIAEKRGITKPLVSIPHALLGESYLLAQKIGLRLPLRFIQLAAQGSSYHVNPRSFEQDYHFVFREPDKGFRDCIE
ncbi:MAG: NAD(P)-dependent oxidoreductase [Candidatus Diapherotrites archaeon]|uniref:NAD(P)-dependent oxidoreductase n=1 Tax=Candidatus Iainarchaeum sp. TaxID=3101447 RepID=A0A8T4C6D1_9ARCH|nr:NAD(P)-dependent oxidoreductase [Candidatus Diapherotrites archaeon]